MIDTALSSLNRKAKAIDHLRAASKAMYFVPEIGTRIDTLIDEVEAYCQKERNRIANQIRESGTLISSSVGLLFSGGIEMWECKGDSYLVSINDGVNVDTIINKSQQMRDEQAAASDKD